VRFNAAAVIWYPVAMIVLVRNFGLEGAAWAWCIYGALAWAFFVLTSTRFIRREGLLSYALDTVLAGACALGAAAGARRAADAMQLKPALSFVIVIVTVGVVLATLYLFRRGASLHQGSSAPFITVSI
jgi:hypothetical protein